MVRKFGRKNLRVVPKTDGKRNPVPPKTVNVVEKKVDFEKLFKASKISNALIFGKKAAHKTTQQRLDCGKDLLQQRIKRLQTEFENMENKRPLVPLDKLLSPRKDAVKTRRMKPFSPRSSKRQPMLTVYSEMSRNNKYAKTAVPYEKPFYIPVAPTAKDNPMKLKSQAELAKEAADLMRDIDPPTIASLRKGYLGAKSPLSKRLTRDTLSKMVTLRHRQEGFLEKNQFYESGLSASKGFGNKKYDPLVNLTEFEKAYKYKKEATDSAITPLYFGFHQNKKKRVEIFVKESLKDKVTEDMYFGKESPATLKKFLDIVYQIKKRVSKKKEEKALIKIFEQFDADKSGSLSRAEFSVGLLELGIHLTASETKLLFHYFDPNDDGTITYHEFLYVVNNMQSLVNQKGRKLKAESEKEVLAEEAKDSLQKKDMSVGKIGKLSESSAPL